MQKQSPSLSRSVAITLFAFLAMHWCAATYADDRDESNIQYGRFDVTRTAAQLVDQLTTDSLSGVIDADESITWQVYVPDSYDPNRPAGLLVYVSPTELGQMPSGWQPLFDEENLIWISANKSGNTNRTKRRLLHAALAPYVLSDRYEIDPSRVYVSGFSGGGKVASIASIHFANLFTGAIYICGTEFRSDVSPTLLSRAQSHRYVFLTGGKDFNRSLTRRIYEEYKRAGMVNINLMTIPGMGHETPDRERFRDAIHYLDRRD